ncbi:unnamed protein product [Staurois parvus]|uniref:Uncharacterized protein n=1 Tax=Staurois parvus TaxID=386267 RepID=A0ABN9DBP2_9NEOB|nr:unnamed protein product [Staurois parvus]
MITGKCNYRFLAALSSRCQSVRKVVPRTSSWQSRDRTDHQGTDDQCPDDRAQQCHPPVLPTFVPVVTQQLCQSMPSNAAYQC